MIDNTSRLVKVGDALSQLCNVLLLPRRRETTSNESISGRCHRCGWRTAERIIDRLFSRWEADHCAKAYEADKVRAEQYLTDYNNKA